MSAAAIHEAFLTAHQRDKKLTILGFVFVLLFLATVVTLLGLFAADYVKATLESILQTNALDDANGGGSSYYRIIIPIAFLAIAIGPIYKLFQISKRPQKIAELIAQIESGNVADSILERTVYKITLPLLKINLRLAPVHYITLQLNGAAGSKSYDLPIPAAAVATLKTFVSGVDTQAVNQAWDKLYETPNQQTPTGEAVPLKSKEAFSEFLRSDFAAMIQEVEQQRKQSSAHYLKMVVIISVVLLGGAAVFFYLKKPNFQFKQEYIYYAVFGLAGVFYSIFYLSKSLKQTNPALTNADKNFKTKILKPVIAFVNPSFQFILHGHVSLPELLETGLLENKNYELAGNDQIIGEHLGVPFQLSDLDVTYKRNFTNEKEGPDQVFYGQAFIAKFNKSFKSEVYVIARKSLKQKAADSVKGAMTLGLANTKSTDIDLYTSNEFGDKVQLEDPEFMELFKVYGDDPIEARYILTPALMERIKGLAKVAEGDLLISFRNNRISILNNSCKNNFELGFRDSMEDNNYELLHRFYGDLHHQLSFIDDLKLNVNIWHKN